MGDAPTCTLAEKSREASLPQKVVKGEEIGMFHYGGSSYCLLLPKGLNLKWTRRPGDGNPKNVAVRSALVEVETPAGQS